jgi:hypothetical protein
VGDRHTQTINRRNGICKKAKGYSDGISNESRSRETNIYFLGVINIKMIISLMIFEFYTLCVIAILFIYAELVWAN